VVDRAIEKLVERAQQLEFAPDGLCRSVDALAAQELKQILLGQHERPHEVGERYMLREAPGPKRSVHVLNFVFGFAEHPVAEVAIHLVAAVMQLARGYSAQTTGALGR